MLTEHERIVKEHNMEKLELLQKGVKPCWSSWVLVVPCSGVLQLAEIQCNATQRKSLEDFCQVSCSASNLLKHGGDQLVKQLEGTAAAYQRDYNARGACSSGLGHATTTGRVLDPGLMSWDSLFFSNIPPFNTIADGFGQLQANEHLPGVRGPVLVAPNICVGLEPDNLAGFLAFLDFPESVVEEKSFYELVADSILQEYAANTRGCV